jgi:hypothetical protein
MILLQCVQMLSLPPCCYNFHSICYCAVCVSGVQYVAWISRIAIVTSYVVNMFFISGLKYSSCLSDVLQRTIQAFNLINFTSTLFIYLRLGLSMFCIVFHVRTANFISVSWRSIVIALASLPLYVKVTHCVFCFCELVCVFCFSFFWGRGVVC